MQTKFSTNFLLYSFLQKRMIFQLTETPSPQVPQEAQENQVGKTLEALKERFYDNKDVIDRIDHLFKKEPWDLRQDKGATILQVETRSGTIRISRTLTPKSIDYEILKSRPEDGVYERTAYFAADITGSMESFTCAGTLPSLKAAELAFLEREIEAEKDLNIAI